MNETMPRLDEPTGHLALKVVFFGPGRGGKTTALRWISRATGGRQRGGLVELATDTERTLFFDFLPLYPGRVAGQEPAVRLGLYTAPGQAFYREAQRLVLRDADAVVFVADSEPGRQEANEESLAALQAGLASWGVDPDQVPLAFLYNKRDAAEALPLGELRRALNPEGRPDAEGVATEGRGVMEVLEALCAPLLRGRRLQGGDKLR